MDFRLLWRLLVAQLDADISEGLVVRILKSGIAREVRRVLIIDIHDVRSTLLSVESVELCLTQSIISTTVLLKSIDL